jgi:hypothetical protein
VKEQITLPEPLADEIRAAASRLKIPIPQFIGETRSHENQKRDRWSG